VLSGGSASPFSGGRLSGGSSRSVGASTLSESLVARVPVTVAGDVSRLSVLNRMGWCGGWDHGKVRDLFLRMCCASTVLLCVDEELVHAGLFFHRPQ
jgi:hypothetical protein